MKNLLTTCLFVICLSVTWQVDARELRLSKIFSDHMVVQRNKPVAIRGQAEKGASVTVAFGTQTRTSTANNDGEWKVLLDAMPANSSPQTLSVTSGDTKTVLKDVVVGEVILFGRQTAIDISLGKDDVGKKAARDYKPKVTFRAISIKTIPSLKPLGELPPESTTGWAVVTSEKAQKLSAAAFYLGHDLTDKGGVPVGIIDLNMGYHFISAWLEYKETPETLAQEKKNKAAKAKMAKRNKKNKKGKGKGKEVVASKPKPEPVPEDPTLGPLCPAAGYNGVLHPLKGLTLGGILLQLGNDYPYMAYMKSEKAGTNLNREVLNRTYQDGYMERKNAFRLPPKQLPLIPAQWREIFADDTLPLAFVSPPGSKLGTLERHSREMGELQRRIAREVSGVDVVLPGSGSVPYSAQPKDEKLLGERSAHWVRARVGKEEGVVGSGPVFKSLETKDTSAVVHFIAGTAEGMTAVGDALTFFEVADAESDFSPAVARIQGNEIHLTSDTLKSISRVRYNWVQNPGQGILNGAGLPASPFISGEHSYLAFIAYGSEDLPEEYSTPADQWKDGDVALISGAQGKSAYREFSGRIGPLGISVSPLGVNMVVSKVIDGSPADSLLQEGDVIFSANKDYFEDFPPQALSAAITESETETKGGKLTLGVRRGEEIIEIKLTLKVMGCYSPTAPWDCPKTERIVSDLEAFIAARWGRTKNFLQSDTLFMLAAGTPKYQALVRKQMQKMESVSGSTNNWYNGYNAILLAEYYLATGDRSILPGLTRICDTIAENQIKNPEAGKRVGSWYGNLGDNGRTYGAMPHAGLASMIGLHLAREAGVKIDEAVYQRGLAHFKMKGADAGIIIYGDAYRDTPIVFEPKLMRKGTMTTRNGKAAVAAVLYKLAGHEATAEICSRVSRYSFFSTFYGHAGNFWNNFWTPIGAGVNGKESLMGFMKGHRWYRELNRRYDGGLSVKENGDPGAGTGLVLIMPRKNLRILGAPLSPFAANAPAALKPALDAYGNKDYKGCQQEVKKLIASGKLDSAVVPTAERLGKIATQTQDAIDAELAVVDGFMNKEDFDQAGETLGTLSKILSKTDSRFATRLAKIGGELKISTEQSTEIEPDDRDPRKSTPSEKQLLQAQALEDMEKEMPHWRSLVTSEYVYDKKSMKGSGAGKLFWGFGKLPADQANQWSIRVLENEEQAPPAWQMPSFDDTTWEQTTLPISWRLNHTVLLRTEFKVEDKEQIERLRFRGWLFRQQNVKVYLNGHLIARVNGVEKADDVSGDFKESALKYLKNGTNTLAYTSRHNWRWGKLSLRVYNSGFSFMLDARMTDIKKEPAENE